MAIDDNTLYGLTGAQVKELPERINAVKGKFTELTADDYDYPDSDPAGIALWRLPTGAYRAASNITTYIARGSSVSLPGVFLVNQSTATTGAEVNVISAYGGGGAASNRLKYTRTYSDGQEWSDYSGNFVTSSEVIDALTSTSSTRVLSAKQGKVLNDKIGGDLSNLNTTDKTSLINAINEVAGQSGGSYTAGDGIDITNNEISATNTGKAKELTADDYNAPVDNPTYIYAGFLEPGLYHIPRGVYFRWSSAMSASNTGEGYILVSDLDANNRRRVYVFSNNASQSSSGEVDLFDWWELSSTSVSWSSTKNAVWAQNLATNVYSSTASNYNVPSQLAVKNALCYPTNSNTVRIGAGAQSNAVVGNGGVLIGRNTGSNNLQDSTILIGSGTAAASNQGGIGIGAGTNVSYRSVAIGHASTSTECQAAIGYGANAGVYVGSVALGSWSGGANITANGMIHIGSSNTSYGYNTSNYRLLTGLYDPQNDHDAATKGYVDTAVSGAGGASLTNAEFNTIFGTNLTEGA